MLNLKINRDWKQIPPDDDTSAMTEPCAYMYGYELHELFNVSEDENLWRECDDGMGDEDINNGRDEMYSVWDGDRFYTAAKKINGA
jgi:hypothetical protein